MLKRIWNSRNKWYSLTSYLLPLTSIILLACGSDSDKFRLEGRLRNMNQGEFWVYSPDGGMVGIDTIKVRDGRFAYELDLRHDATLVIVFPNYSEQPVFASPGKTVTIKGEATHLKEMIIQGTKDNEDMTTLRMELNDLTPPDHPAAAAAFIEQHPSSPASLYVLLRYMMQAPQPDYRQIHKLTKVLLKEQPDNRLLQTLDKQLPHLKGGRVGSKMPAFKVTDIQGKTVTAAQLRKKANVIVTWASWSYTSTGMLYKLKQLQKRHGDKLSIVAVCLDGTDNDCKERVKRDSLLWPTICDGRMWDSPLLTTFGLADVPDNVVIDGKGRILVHHLTVQHLEEYINHILK